MFLKRCDYNRLSNEEKIVGATQFASEITENSEKFYKDSHDICRGIH